MTLSSELNNLKEEKKNLEIAYSNSGKKEKEKLEEEIKILDQKINSNQKQTKKLKSDLEDLKTISQDLELKRNIITSVLKENIEEPVSYSEAKLKYFDLNSNNSTNKYENEIIALKQNLGDAENKLIEINESYQNKKDNLLDEELTNNEVLNIEIERKKQLTDLKNEILSNNSDNEITSIGIENYINEEIQEIDSKIAGLQESEIEIENTNLANNNKSNENNSTNSNLKNEAQNNESENENQKEIENTNLANNNKSNENNSTNSNLKNEAQNNESENENQKEIDNTNLANNNKSNENNSTNSNLNNEAQNNEGENENQNEIENTNLANSNKSNENNSTNSNLNNEAQNNEGENENQNEIENTNLANSNKSNENNSTNLNLKNEAQNNKGENENQKEIENTNLANSNKSNENNSTNSNLNNEAQNNEGENENQNEIENTNLAINNKSNENNSTNSNLKNEAQNNEGENENQNEIENNNLANNNKSNENNSTNSNLNNEAQNNEGENENQKEIENTNVANSNKSNENNSTNSNLNNEAQNNESENENQKEIENNNLANSNKSNENNSTNSNLNNEAQNNEGENENRKEIENTNLANNNKSNENNSTNSNLNNEAQNNEGENENQKEIENTNVANSNKSNENNTTNSNLKNEAQNNEGENENQIQNSNLPHSDQNISELSKDELENQISTVDLERENIINELRSTYPNLSFQNESQLSYEIEKLENDQFKIESEIDQLKEQLSTEKNKKNRLEIQSKLVEKEQINDRIKTGIEKTKNELAKISKPTVSLNLTETKQEINEEKKNDILSSEAYKSYVVAIVDFEKEQNRYLELSNQLTEAQEKLNNRINQQVITRNDKKFTVEIESLVTQIESIKTQRNSSYKNLQDKKNSIEKIENENPEVKSELQFLVVNRIEPIRKSVVNNDPIISSGGFEIKSITNSSNLSNQPIPINVKSPSGLVYRVQVGAFRKPLQQNVYSGFTPVSGELQTNGLTVYLAGYFNSSIKAVEARKQIQQLGYTDAFVVAYCNGKKLTLGEARQLEAKGECIPNEDNDFLAEISRNTKEALKEQNIDLSNQPINKSSTNFDSKKLFFTVQIGVYNKPINENQKFPGLTEISSNISPSKQIRYSTGKFSDLESAKTRKNVAVTSGISDAFIVAYYQGERITINKANELISQNGNSILENEQNLATESNSEIKLESYEKPFFSQKEKEPEIRKIKYQINQEFEDFPKEKLEYFNNYGLFQYNSLSRKIETIEFLETNDLNDAIKFSGFVERLNVTTNPEEKLQNFTMGENQFNGDLADFILRSNCIQSIETKKEISVILNSSILTNENYTNLLKDTFELKIETYEPK